MNCLSILTEHDYSVLNLSSNFLFLDSMHQRNFPSVVYMLYTYFCKHSKIGICMFTLFVHINNSLLILYSSLVSWWSHVFSKSTSTSGKLLLKFLFCVVPLILFFFFVLVYFILEEWQNLFLSITLYSLVYIVHL